MPELRDRLAKSRQNLEFAVENTLYDLGPLGKRKAREILAEVQDELDDIEAIMDRLGIEADNA